MCGGRGIIGGVARTIAGASPAASIARSLGGGGGKRGGVVSAAARNEQPAPSSQPSGGNGFINSGKMDDLYRDLDSRYQRLSNQPAPAQPQQPQLTPQAPTIQPLNNIQPALGMLARQYAENHPGLRAIQNNGDGYSGFITR